MGVHDQPTALRAQKTEGKANQFLVIERAHPYASSFPGCDGQSQRRGVEFGKTPDFPLDLFDLLQVFKAAQVANRERRFGFRLSHGEAGESRNNIREKPGSRQPEQFESTINAPINVARVKSGSMKVIFCKGPKCFFRLRIELIQDE